MKTLFHPVAGCLAFLMWGSWGCQVLQRMGHTPSAETRQLLEKLPNYHNGQFQNRKESGIPAGKVRASGVLHQYLHPTKGLRPSKPVPSVKTDLVHTAYEKPTVIWFGHSCFLIKTASLTILVDPNLSDYAGPFSGMVRAFGGSTPYQVADLPPIDVLLISHDHYDHLDYQTVRQLRAKVKRVIAPIGVGGHLLAWGYPLHLITELNWGQSAFLAHQLRITATEARHFSNRSFTNNQTLWASYVMEVDGYRLFYTGDGGYGPHFKRIGQQYGPFDLAMMECGQYSANWPSSHMFPEQTAQAAADLQVRTLVPVHWAKFRESFHPWNEPIRRLLPAAKGLGIAVSVPRIGEPYTVGEALKNTGWWNFD